MRLKKGIFVKIIKARCGQEAHYKSPAIFMQTQNYPRDADLRNYLEEELVAMAQEGNLSVTDILNQPQRIWQICGMIILGQSWDNMTSPAIMRVDPSMIPHELQTYRVKLRSLNGKSITWKRGLEPRREMKNRAGRAPLLEEVWVDAESTEAELFLKDAWLCLRQKGKYCRRASRASLQAKYWTIEEVRENIHPMEIPKKRGRPSLEATG